MVDEARFAILETIQLEHGGKDQATRRLLTAVLESACQDLGLGDRKLYTDAVNWILGCDARCTFQCVCEYLNLNESAVRAALLKDVGHDFGRLRTRSCGQSRRLEMPRHGQHC